MVSARAQFLGEGHYAPIAQTVAELAGSQADISGLVMEAGAGTGYYIARVLDNLPEHVGLAFDLSKYAARRAAKAHERLDAIVADVYDGLPLKDGSIDVAINVFAPRPALELFRKLRNNGKLIVAIPASRHMEELRGSLGLLDIDCHKEARMAYALNPFFKLLERHSCCWNMELNHRQVTSLAQMGPSARHIDSPVLAEKVDRLRKDVSVSAAMNIFVYVRAQVVSCLIH